jgi:predicted Zn-dependent peptidase
VKTIQRLLSLWHDYLEGGLKGDELKLAQESLVNSYPFEFDSPEKRLWQRLYSYLYDVPVLSPEDYAKTINGVSNKKLIDALHKHHNGEGWLITLVADKNVIEKQLSEAQKDVPEAKRLTISKVLNPGQVIQ